MADRLGPYRSKAGYNRAPNNDEENQMYEMNYNGSNYNRPAAYPSRDEFFAEAAAIKQAIDAYEASITTIATLHSRSLTSLGDHTIQDDLKRATEESRRQAADLKGRIKALQAQGGESPEARMRRDRANFLKEAFMSAIQRFQKMERDHRASQRAHMERQYRIVNPNATAEEIKQVTESTQPGQVFQQALLSSRVNESKSTYRAVQERHEDLLKIEQTLAELAQLFSDMQLMVAEQGDMVAEIEKTTGQVLDDAAGGEKQMKKATRLAKLARDKRKICFCIVVIVIIIVAIVVGIEVAKIVAARKAADAATGNNNNQ